MGNIDGFGQYKIGGTGGGGSSTTIYTGDSTVTNTRTVDGNGNQINFNNINGMQITGDGSPLNDTIHDVRNNGGQSVIAVSESNKSVLVNGGASTGLSYDSATVFQIDSTSQGFLKPRMTGAQVEAISTPPEGLEVYATNAGAGDVTEAGWWGYNGTNWVQINGGSSVSGANPTQAITGTVVNGTAATFMRSDAAPALSDTGAVAGTYGDSSNIPSFTIDAKGRVTAIGTEPTQSTGSADPTASVGSSATNGVATTYMRSDAAPALDTTGVTAATYGDASNVAQFTVDANGRITSATDVAIGGGISAFTAKAGGATIDWDYATDGVNIKVTMVAGVENAIVVSDINEFPDGSSGFLILDPINTTTYRLPSEDYGSDTGIQSLITNGDPFTEGSNPVRMHWVYDGANFWFDRDINMIEPIYPPSVEFDTTNLIAFYHPDSYNQAVAGTVTSSDVPNIATSTIIGDLVIGANTTNFTYEPKTLTTPSFWSLGGASNTISKTLAGSLSTIASASFYIQQPASTGYSGLIDFYDGSGSFTETLYLLGREFTIFSPAVTFGYPELLDYTGTGGANLLLDWLFVSFSIDNAANEFVLYVGTQSSLDAAVAAGGATNWDYDGNGNTVAVDADGLYKETVSATITETTFDRFYYGNASAGSESSRCHQGMLGVYGAVLSDAQVQANWVGSRGTYFIT